MNRRVSKIYVIQFQDEKAVQMELKTTLLHSVDVLNEVTKSLLRAANDLENRRRLTNFVLNERESIRIKETDILWAYFSPELTQSNQTKFRSFIVKTVIHERDRIILITQLTYEKNRNWFDPKLL